SITEASQKYLRLFQIDDDKDNMLSLNMLQPRHHLLMVPVVTREFDDTQLWIAIHECERDLEGIVRRSVVDHDDFVIVGDLCRFLRNASMELLDMRSRLVKRGHDGELHEISDWRPTGRARSSLASRLRCSLSARFRE